MVTMAFSSRCSIFLVFAGCAFVCWGCKPTVDDNTTYAVEWKVMMSDIVTHGVVISTEPDPSSEDAYSVNFEVRCIYKGERIPEIIRIKNVGYNPKNCLHTSLHVGSKHLVFLNKTDDGQFVQQFPQDSGEPQNVDELVILCEVIVAYPVGRNETYHQEECPDKYESEEDCVARPTVASPSYANDEHHIHSHGSGDKTVDQKTKVESGKDIPRKPVESPSSVGDDDNGSSVTMTLNMSAMIFLLFAIILQL